MAPKKSQLEVDDQSCKGPLCKFRSTSFFHYFTKGKIFDITFQLKQIVTQNFLFNQPNVLWQLTQEETFFTQLFILVSFTFGDIKQNVI